MSWTVSLVNSGLNGTVANAIADGSLTYQEVLQLLNTVAVGGLTPSKLGDLQTIYTNSIGIFSSDYVRAMTYNVVYGNPANSTWWGGQSAVADADTQGNLSGSTSESDALRLIGEWFLGKDLPIAVAGGDSATGKVSSASYSYSTASGPVFLSGIAASDVDQGSVGTCYFLAALGAIAHVNSAYISNAITDNGNGTYGVRLYVNGAAIYTTVNLDLPTKYSGSSAFLPFAAGGSHSLTGELWVSIFEKAYAQFNAQANVQGESSWRGESSYQAVEGGWAYPIKEITGLNYKYYARPEKLAYDSFSAGSVSMKDASTLKQTLISALSAGSIGWLGVLDQQYKDPTNGKLNFVAGPGSGHAYMLLGYNSATDNFIVRNPWGDSTSTSTYNGQFEVSADVLWQYAVIALTDATIADPVYTYSVSSNAGTTANAVTEGANVTFTITRSGKGFASTVYVSTVSGTADSNDFKVISKSPVTFTANETSKTVTVTTLSDALTEGNETFSLNVFKQASDFTSVASTTANIKDVAQKAYTYSVTSSASDATTAASEGTKIVFTITRSSTGTGADTASTVYVSTAGISANASDFAGLNKTAVTFAAFDISKDVSVDTVIDNINEGTESFSLDVYKNIGDSTKSTTATGYIKDQYQPSFTYSITSDASTQSKAAYEGTKVSFTITRSGSGAASTVYLSTVNGSAGTSDYAGFAQKPVTFAANQTVVVVTVDVLNDTWLEAVEYFKLNLYELQTDATYLASSTAFIQEPVAVVKDYTYSVSSSASSASPIEEGGTITFTVTRSDSGTTSTVYV
jgi:hypothetical protein